MTWLLGLFGGALLRYIISGAAIMAVIGAFWLWHSANYVQRSELRHQIELNTKLRQAAEDKERIGKADEKARIEAEEKIDELEKENERLHQEDMRGDDPVLIPRDELKRLRKR